MLNLIPLVLVEADNGSEPEPLTTAQLQQIGELALESNLA